MIKMIPVLALIILMAACKNKKSSTGTPVTPPITDIDGNVYNTVTIGSQLWMKVNLNTTRYRNGDIIPNVTDQDAWGELTTGAWCWYNNDSATNGSTYGKLYNWYAVNDPRGLAPEGYHIPSDAEWTALETELGGDDVSGGEMKETGTKHWNTPNTDAANSSGFTALPGGYRNVEDGSLFSNVGSYGYWWSSTEAWHRNLNYRDGFINKSDRIPENFALSVRCLRD